MTDYASVLIRQRELVNDSVQGHHVPDARVRTEVAKELARLYLENAEGDAPEVAADKLAYLLLNVAHHHYFGALVDGRDYIRQT